MGYYKLKDERYLLLDKDGNVLDIMNEVAVCFDAKLNVCLSHGSPDSILKYYKDTVQRLKNVDFNEIIKDITIIQSKFPIEELNKLSQDATYIIAFIENIRRINEID